MDYRQTPTSASTDMNTHASDYQFPMPTHINILLDDLLIDNSHSVSGNTEPSILNGLLDNVTFVPWVGFRNIVSDALHVLNCFTSEQLVEVDTSLHKARRFIKESRKDHVMCLELQKKRKAEHDFKVASKVTKQSRRIMVAHRLDDMVISNKDEGRTVSGAVSSEFHQLGRSEGDNRVDAAEISSSEDEVPNWRVELPVNTSSSILDLHKDIFDALREMLRLMYPVDLLRLDSKTISCENLFSEKRGKMLYKYMHKIIKDHHASKTIEHLSEKNFSDTGEAKNLAQRTLSSENTNRDPVSLRHHNDAPGPGVINSQRDKGESANFIRRSARIAEKLNEPKKEDHATQPLVVPVRPIIRLSQTPDRALFRIAENDRGAIPVCCYEYKAPALDLSGLQISEISETSVPKDRSSSTPHDSLRKDAKNEDDDDQSEDFMYLPGLSAKIIANEYNRLFKNPLHMDKKRPEYANERVVLLPIAQVICQALLSKTGCVFLTNHQMSFALRVEENKEKFGAKIYVTGAIPSNQVPGQFAAMLGFSKYCMDRVMQENERDMLDPQRRLLNSLSYKAYHADISDEQLDPDWCPMGPPHDGSSQGPQSGTYHGHNRGVAGPVVGKSEILFDNYDGDVLSDRTNALTSQELNDARGLSRSAMDERLKEMFATTGEVLGVGASGVIVQGVWDGKKVAIKMWNGHNRNGFLSIRREIRVYERLREKCPYLLGRAVPGYVLGWDRPQALSVYRKELILILENVGDRIWKDRDEKLWIDSGNCYEMVEMASIPAVCDAALSSLTEIHAQGFLHGDIAFRNVRVAKTGSGWKAWWLDLGDAIEVSDDMESLCFKLEKIKCRSIFKGLSSVSLKNLESRLIRLSSATLV